MVNAIRAMFEKDRVYAVKKCIAFALIIFGMVFVAANSSVYYSDHTRRVKIKKAELENPVIIEFEGNKTFEQEFMGWDGELRSISLRFSNQGNQAAEGVVTLNILDSDGQLLQTTSKSIAKIKTTKRSYFQFEEPAKLSDEKRYILQMVVEGAHNEQGFGVLTFEKKRHTVW